MSNVKTFPINSDTKLNNLLKDFSKTLDREFGANTYAGYVTIVHAPEMNKVDDTHVEVTSYRFTVTPDEKEEESVETLTGLLYRAISKDPNIGGAVMHAYAQKLAEILGTMVAQDDDEEDVGVH